MTADAASIRRFASLALVAGLCLAAAAAVLALLTGDFGEIDLRVILTSIGFAFASATGSTGAAARLSPSETLQTLGTLTRGRGARDSRVACLRDVGRAQKA